MANVHSQPSCGIHISLIKDSAASLEQRLRVLALAQVVRFRGIEVEVIEFLVSGIMTDVDMAFVPDRRHGAVEARRSVGIGRIFDRQAQLAERRRA